MQDLIGYGVCQGGVFSLSEGIEKGSLEFNRASDLVKNGRFSAFSQKAYTADNLIVVLTQDCTIAGRGSYIEFAQLKPYNVGDVSKIQHKTLGKDYNELVVKFDSKYFKLEEILITKIKKKDFLELIRDKIISAGNPLTPREVRILLDWRVLAYKREPFPDGFNSVFFEYLQGKGSWLPAFLIENQDAIDGIRVFVTPEEDQNAACYEVSFCALLTQSGEGIADVVEEKIVDMLKELNEFKSIRCLQLGVEDGEEQSFPDGLTLDLTSTYDEFTFANAFVLREFNFQYLCY